MAHPFSQADQIGQSHRTSAAPHWGHDLSLVPRTPGNTQARQRPDPIETAGLCFNPQIPSHHGLSMARARTLPGPYRWGGCAPMYRYLRPVGNIEQPALRGDNLRLCAEPHDSLGPRGEASSLAKPGPCSCPTAVGLPSSLRDPVLAHSLPCAVPPLGNAG